MDDRIPQPRRTIRRKTPRMMHKYNSPNYAGIDILCFRKMMERIERVMEMPRLKVIERYAEVLLETFTSLSIDQRNMIMENQQRLKSKHMALLLEGYDGLENKKYHFMDLDGRYSVLVTFADLTDIMEPKLKESLVWILDGTWTLDPAPLGSSTLLTTEDYNSRLWKGQPKWQL